MNPLQSVRSILAVVLMASMQAWASPPVQTPITFASSGAVTLTFMSTNAGFDHVLELASTIGPVGTPIFVASTASASAAVLGFTPATPNQTFLLGSYTANTELIFRLTNVGSDRFSGSNGVGEVDSQVFSGSAGGLNPNPLLPWVNVASGGPNTLHVGFEDLFPEGSAYDKLTFTLTLAPIPEPSEWAMMLAGLGVVGVIAKRRRAAPQAR